MKTLLIVCEAFGGGVFTYVTQLCNDMADEFDVYLAFSLRPQTPKNYKDFLDERIHLIETNFLSIKRPVIIRVIKSVRELRKIEAEVKPDIIHLHSSIAGGVGRLAFNGKRNKVVYTPHGYAHILMGKKISSMCYYIIEKILGRRKCITLTCCESENEEAKKFCKNTTYIETGLNVKEFGEILGDIEPIENDRLTVYTLGRICEQKQPEVFNQIAKLVPEARFIWIGDGDQKYKLTNVEVTGWKSREEALAIAKGADIFVLCSLGEAIAMSLLESMYMKKLVLVSDVIGNKSVVENGKNGYICKIAEDYAKRIKEYITNYPIHISEQAFSDVKNKYSDYSFRVKCIDFYRKLLEL